MKSFYTLVLCLLFIAKSACGQRLVWASFEKFGGSNTYSNVIGENSDGILMVRYKDKNLRKNVFIDYYDHGLRLKNTIGVADKKRQLDKILILEDELICIYKYFNYDNIQFYYKRINYKETDQKTELTEWHKINTNEGKTFNLITSYNWSRNIASFSYLTEENDQSLFNISYFKADLKSENLVSYKIPFAIKEIQIQERMMDKKGNFYMIYTSEKNNLFKKSAPICHLLTYNKSTKKWDDKEINNEDFYVSTVMLKEDIANNRIICSYFYSPNFRNGNFGMGSIQVNSDNQDFITSRKIEVDEEFARSVSGNKSNSNKELNSFIIQDIVPTADSGFIVISERFFVSDQNETFYQNGLPITTSRNVYNFEEVMIYSFNKMGFLNWNKVLLKRQNSINDAGYFSSIVVIPSVDKLHIIYNEKLNHNGDVIQFSIDQNGTTSQKNLFRRDMSSYMIIPTESRLIGYNRSAIPAMLSNGERGLLKIVY